MGKYLLIYGLTRESGLLDGVVHWSVSKLSFSEIALKFEQFRQKYPHNKDSTWFLKKAAEDLFVFIDQLQGVNNLPEANRKIASIDFELLIQLASVGPFVGFTDPRKIIRNFASRISQNLFWVLLVVTSIFLFEVTVFSSYQKH